MRARTVASVPLVYQSLRKWFWLRFELVEHIRLPKDSTFASMCEFSPLWLDDFGTGMANFSALSEVRYDYIKIARDLFVMLRQSPEGLTNFSSCRGTL